MALPKKGAETAVGYASLPQSEPMQPRASRVIMREPLVAEPAGSNQPAPLAYHSANTIRGEAKPNDYPTPPAVARSDIRIIRELGRGGAGTVYLAIHKTGKKVAVKELNREFATDKEARDRFLREASILMDIQDHNIIRLMNLPILGDEGQIYLVLEYVNDSKTLTALIEDKTNPLALPLALDIFRQIAKGLAAAHAVGVIHRDMKPDNVLITKNRRGEVVVKIIDFGIAKSEIDVRKTMTKGILGTPNYMAPEQVNEEPLTPATDVHALGIIMYEVLSGGQLPYEGEKQYELLGNIAGKPPIALDKHALLPGTSNELVCLVMKCLAKNPTMRPVLTVPTTEDGKPIKTTIHILDELIASAPASVWSEPTTLINTTGVSGVAGTLAPSTSTIRKQLPHKGIGKLAFAAAAFTVLSLGGAGAYFGTRPDHTESVRPAAIARHSVLAEPQRPMPPMARDAGLRIVRVNNTPAPPQPNPQQVSAMEQPDASVMASADVQLLPAQVVEDAGTPVIAVETSVPAEPLTVERSARIVTPRSRSHRNRGRPNPTAGIVDPNF